MPPLPSPPNTVADSLRYTDPNKRAVKRSAAEPRTPVATDASAKPVAPVEQGAQRSTRAVQQDRVAAPANKLGKVPTSQTLHTSQKPQKSRPALPNSTPVAVAQRKLFVLDTNVLLHDPNSLFRFQEHDIFIPMIVLEELDRHKTGLNEVARNARQVSRHLDALCNSDGVQGMQAIALAGTGQVQARGDLYFQDATLLPAPAQTQLLDGKADNQILTVAQALTTRYAPRTVTLVSKDINMRIKARALALHCEDYTSDRTLDDDELLHSGMQILPVDFWQVFERNATKRKAQAAQHQLESWVESGDTYYHITSPLTANWQVNQMVVHEAEGEAPLYAMVTGREAESATLRTLKDHSHDKQSVWGICARNREQNFALNLLLDPNIDLVTITGTAGSGKTLLALAAGLQLVLEDKRYSEIVMTRATISVGDDIGFLPGTEEEKMQPWMGAVDDNLEVLAQVDGSAGEWGRAATQDLIRSKIKIRSLSFMRGRTFLQRFVIIDEAQNLTPKQMKTLLTRAGPGTKMVCMGNLGQIDTPYLTEGSSGLTYLVDRMQGWAHAGHITLARGERSRLADFASDNL